MLAKLVAGWLGVSALLILIAAVWLHADLVPAADSPVLVKLSLLIVAASSAGFVLTYVLARRWAARVQILENFAATLPATVSHLPGDGPPELRNLSRAMRKMAGQVQRIVESAELESSRHQTVLAGIAEGVLAVDEQLRVIFCNDAFAQSFSTRNPVSPARPLYEVVREPALRDLLESVVRTGAPEKDLFRSPTAAGRWFEATVLPLGRASRVGAIAVLHDITEMRHQEQARKDFVANVSHELRTPLASIRGYAETLLDGALEDQTHNRKFVEIILAHSIRLNNIASDLLVLSELDSNAPAIAADRVQVLQALDSALNTVESGAKVQGVRLVKGDCQECAIVGHRFRLEQALVNLLDNAVKFNRPDGQVTATCGYTDDCRVRITVADTGIGIPSEDLKRIFERFYRVDKARSPQAGGTGLGLPIVKEIIDRMNGIIIVESQLGKGSIFTIILPSL